MICPVCKTNNTKSDMQYCIQCGSDLYVHNLLNELGETIQMKNEIIETASKKLNWLLIIGQIGSIVFLLGCAVFGIFVGIRFLTFIEHEEAYRISQANKRAEINYEQLQQMSYTIKQEFDLILEQRRENQILQTKIQELTAIVSKNTEEKNKYLSTINDRGRP